MTLGTVDIFMSITKLYAYFIGSSSGDIFLFSCGRWLLPSQDRLLIDTMERRARTCTHMHSYTIDFIRIEKVNLHERMFIEGSRRVSYQAFQDYKIQRWNKIPASHSAKTFACHTPSSKPRLCRSYLYWCSSQYNPLLCWKTHYQLQCKI